MRLVDQIGVEPPFTVENERLGETFRVRNAADFRLKLQATPQRFILDSAATAFCTDFFVQQAGLLGDSVDILRFPAHRFWIEWAERTRVETLAALRPGPFAQRAEVPTETRAGALVEINSDGRSGKAWLFTGGAFGAVLCPLYLDFNTQCPPAVEAQPVLRQFKFANPALPELDGLSAWCTINVERSWYDYCRSATASDQHFNAEILRVASMLHFDWPMIAAFSLLYPLPRPFVRRPSDLGKLNRARDGKGKPALLDHVEISASLVARAESDRDGPGPGFGSGKRLHHVRGHLVRRGDRVFWRSPHLRGKPELGEIATRTVRVTA
jgi:hypothetical protein